MNTNLFNKMFKTKAGMFLTVIGVGFICFEIFNFGTTQYAFSTVFGGVDSGGMWAFILAVAFCSIDLAGLARLFTPEQGNDEPAEVWYLFGAWILAAAMNATLTWWGVASAMQNVTIPPFASGAERIIPVFVAVLVWVIRILLIGSFSLRGDAFLHGKERKPQLNVPQSSQKGSQAFSSNKTSQNTSRPFTPPVRPPVFNMGNSSKTQPKKEPTYHNPDYKNIIRRFQDDGEDG